MNLMGQQESPTQCPTPTLGSIRRIYVSEGRGFRTKNYPHLIILGDPLGYNFKSFDTKKLAMKWFASNVNNEESKETCEMSEGKTKHFLNTCKFNREDEKKGEMIESCLCKRWYHIECITSENVKTSNKEGQDESETSKL